MCIEKSSARASFTLNAALTIAITVSIFFAIVPSMTAGSKNNSVSRKTAFQIRAQKAEAQLRAYRSTAKSILQKSSFPADNSRTAAGYSFKNIASTASKIFFYDDMESGVNGWTTAAYADPAAQWHQTTAQSNSPTHSWWPGVDDSGTYNTGRRVSNGLISPPIDLSGGSGNLTLLFTENYVTERGWDFCMVDISNDDGLTWHHLRGGYAAAPSGDSYGWIVSSLNLTPYANQTVRIRFAFDTGDSLFNKFPGWFVDNVMIFDEAGVATGRVFFDINKNGMQDGADAGLGAWFVTATGPVTITVQTDDQGDYRIPLPLGSYQITEALTAPWTMTTPTVSWPVTLTVAGDSVGGLTFGNYRSGTIIKALAFADTSKNGLREPGEPALPNWYFEISDQYNNWMDGGLTDSSGEISFIVFTPGRYYVQEFPDYHWASSVPGGDQPSYAIDVPSADTVMGDYLFGNYNVIVMPSTAAIRGFLFNDQNHNGLFDEHEPTIQFTSVVLTTTGDEQATDSAGRFAFQNLPAGTYTVRATNRYGWMQTLPDSLLTFTLADGELKDSVAIGVFLLPPASFRGTIYNDLNRNGIRDSSEAWLSGWWITASGPDYFYTLWQTDTGGRYSSRNIFQGYQYDVGVKLPDHWAQSNPPLNYIFAIDSTGFRDSVDFGVYHYNPSSIAGTIFNDLNTSASYDPGEPGLGGFQVQLINQTQVLSTVTDDSGRYHFNGLWKGEYDIALVLQSDWRQTYPLMLGRNHVSLGNEVDRTGIDFGVVYDTTFSLALRSFLPESIAYARDQAGKLRKAVLPKGYATRMSTIWIKPDFAPEDSAQSLNIKFGNPSKFISISASRGSVLMVKNGWFRVDFSGAYLQATDSVKITGVYLKTKPPLVRSWWFSLDGTNNSTINSTDLIANYQPLDPMPNEINLVNGVVQNTPPGQSALTVGLGGAHSIYHRSASDILKSLVDNHGMHIGPPRCLDHFSHTTKSINRLTKTLTPTKGNNILFSELIALKLNVRASEIGMTPGGLGTLIFRDTAANPFNGLSIYQILGRLDTAMSAFDEKDKTHPLGGDSCLYDSVNFFQPAYRTVRLINQAFAGPTDTISFGGPGGLVFSPVRSLKDVLYLHLDSSYIFGSTPAQIRTPLMLLPEKFALQQNYPNPFNPTTMILFSLPEAARVTLTIYNTLGQQVATLFNKQDLEEGEQAVEFNPHALASGVYFYRLEATGYGDKAKLFSETKKMMLLK
jgi:hypothetical protein